MSRLRKDEVSASPAKKYIITFILSFNARSVARDTEIMLLLHGVTG